MLIFIPNMQPITSRNYKQWVQKHSTGRYEHEILCLVARTYSCKKCEIVWVMTNEEIAGYSRVHYLNGMIEDWNICYAKCKISNNEYAFKELLG